MIISHCVLPPGGWVFTQGKVLLIAETFDLLVKNVRGHRIANGIPAGDIEKDIEEQLVSRFPTLRKDNVLA
jgi:hypothetical protein